MLLLTVAFREPSILIQCTTDYALFRKSLAFLKPNAEEFWVKNSRTRRFVRFAISPNARRLLLRASTLRFATLARKKYTTVALLLRALFAETQYTARNAYTCSK